MSSFVKIKKDSSCSIPGVKTSIRNGQICSTGNSSLDFVIGGGIELNSIFLIGEDQYGRYTNVLSKLFLADGVHHMHKIYFANLDDDPRELIKDIPPPLEHHKNENTEQNLNSNDLRIAFRYQGLPKIDSVQRGIKSGVGYDLSKKCVPEMIAHHENISYFSFMEEFQQRRRETNQNAFEMIIQDLQKLAAENKDSLLRVCINSVGSPLWYTETFSEDLLMFLVRLKSITRYNENIVCLITIPMHIINTIDEQLVFKIRKIVDCNINLESFDNVEKKTNAVYKEYHGLIHIKKLMSINALQSHKPEAFDLAFKLKSIRFLIEKLHLPPELHDNEPSDISAMSCTTSGGSSKLDF